MAAPSTSTTEGADRGVLPAGIDGGGDWTIFIPTYMAADWTALAQSGGRAPVAGTASSADVDVAPDEAVGLAAHLAVGERVAARAGGVFMPMLFVQTAKAKKEDKRVSIAKVIYGILLCGTLAFFASVMDAWHTGVGQKFVVWTIFGLLWGLMSVGHHISLGETVHPLGLRYIEFTAHLSLTLFCCLVMFFIYLHLPKGRAGLIWLILMEVFFFIAHLTAWILIQIRCGRVP